ncbi:hypothetical protein MASR1M74_21050 [Lentimicrobium sp.]
MQEELEKLIIQEHFEFAEVPPDNSGLSEFGMGMKSASFVGFLIIGVLHPQHWVKRS